MIKENPHMLDLTKIHAFVGWAAQLIMWGAPKKNVPKCSANGKQYILLLVLTLVLSCLVDWMIELSISNKEQTRHIVYFTLYSFNTPSGASVAVEDPYAATTAWHLLLMLVTNLVTRCCGMEFHSSTRIHCSSASVIPTSVELGLGLNSWQAIPCGDMGSYSNSS